MQPFIEQAQIYFAHHSREETIYTHIAGVSLLLLSLFILTGLLYVGMPNVFHIKLSTILAAAMLFAYARLNILITLLLTPILIMLCVLGSLIAHNGLTTLCVWLFCVSFLASLILLLVGHYIEGKHASMFTHFKINLNAPLFLTAAVMFSLNKCQKLEEKVRVIPLDDSEL